MATQSITANLDNVHGQGWDSARALPSRFSGAALAGADVRAKQHGDAPTDKDRVQRAIARSKQDAELIDFFVNWWPFDLLRSLANWLQCWGCNFAVRSGNDLIPAGRVRDDR